jgi:hypothetical protein
MGTKYEVSHLRNLAVARLHYIYPSGLRGFRSRGYELAKEVKAGSQFTIAAISLARTCNVPSIMPLCFLLNIWVTAPKTLANRALRNGAIYTAEDGTIYTVSPEDSDLCLSGAWKLAERRRQDFHEAFKARTRPACSDSNCLRDLLHKTHNEPPPTTSSLPALYVLAENFLLPWRLCAQCVSEVKPVWTEAVGAMWRDLPSYFDLPPWEQLLAVESVE